MFQLLFSRRATTPMSVGPAPRVQTASGSTASARAPCGSGASAPQGPSRFEVDAYGQGPTGDVPAARAIALQVLAGAEGEHPASTLAVLVLTAACLHVQATSDFTLEGTADLVCGLSRDVRVHRALLGSPMQLVRYAADEFARHSRTQRSEMVTGLIRALAIAARHAPRGGDTTAAG